MTEFMAWWSDEHAELAQKMPGPGYYALHEVEGGMGRDPEWDGVAELTFIPAEVARAAFASPEGVATLEHANGRRGARQMLETSLLRLVEENGVS
jgi:uncharacterized protein (TIGR02118 family)